MILSYFHPKLNNLINNFNIKHREFIFCFVALALTSITLGLVVGNVIAPKNYIVSLTRDGFEPDNIVIAKGDSITWINTDTRPHWPASNSHPTHMEYKTATKGCLGSKLDACRGLKKGESFPFVFDQEGIFGMHDHLIPGDTLSVEVVSRISYRLHLNRQKTVLIVDSKSLPAPLEFRKLNYGEKRLIIRQIAKKDPRFAWDYLVKVAMENGEVVDNVHEFAHTIGRETYRQSGFEGIKICSEEFAYGCYHGVTEQALLTTGKDSLSNLEKECLKFFPYSSRKRIDDPGCIHGMGHGLLTWNNLDINRSLEDCNGISNSYRSFCWNGVFMEYSMSGTPSFDEKDPWKFCRELSSIYQDTCASYSVANFSRYKEFNVKLFANYCGKAPSKQMEADCLHRVGYQIVENSKGDIGSILQDCGNLEKKEEEAFCLRGAATEVSFQKYANWKTTVSRICSEIPTRYAVGCINRNN